MDVGGEHEQLHRTCCFRAADLLRSWWKSFVLSHCCDSILLDFAVAAGSVGEPERGSAMNSPWCETYLQCILIRNICIYTNMVHAYTIL